MDIDLFVAEGGGGSYRRRSWKKKKKRKLKHRLGARVPLYRYPYRTNERHPARKANTSIYETLFHLSTLFNVTLYLSRYHVSSLTFTPGLAFAQKVPFHMHTLSGLAYSFYVSFFLLCPDRSTHAYSFFSLLVLAVTHTHTSATGQYLGASLAI